MEPPDKKLLDQACTEQCQSVRDAIRHPAQMGAAEVEAIRTHLAVKASVAASTQNPCTERHRPEAVG